MTFAEYDQAWQELVEILVSTNDDNYDPTPWCHQCGAPTADKCKCGPIADNN